MTKSTDGLRCKRVDDELRNYRAPLDEDFQRFSLETSSYASGASILKESEPNKSLYLFFENCGAEKISYSLYKIEIDLKIKKSGSPRLVKEFKRAEFPAQGMKCAKLGSKLYFLGGSYEESYKRVHPRHVYVLDVLEKRGKLEKMGATLNTGKPHPCAVFAVNGKLYALGTIIYDPYNPSTLSPSPFECFDPKTGEWQVVNDLPPSEDKSIFWVGCTVLEKRQEAVLMGSESPTSDHVLVKFVFDIKKEENKWTRALIFRREEGPLTLSFHEGDEDDYLYGIHYCLGLPLKSKTGCISWSEENALFSGKHVDGLIQMSIDNATTPEQKNQAFHGKHVDGLIKMSIDNATTPEQKTQVFHQPYLNSSRTVRHLGNNYFCYITSGSNPRDPDSRGIMITLFEESGEEKHSFKASILNSESCPIKTHPEEAQTKLVVCFVATPECTSV